MLRRFSVILKGLCPVYIQVGECEILLSDSTRFADKARLSEVDVTCEVWPNMFHAWQGFWMVMPEGMAAIEKLGAYIKSKLSTSSPAGTVAKPSVAPPKAA
jgi:acetyl esterase/lipase